MACRSKVTTDVMEMMAGEREAEEKPGGRDPDPHYTKIAVFSSDFN